MNLEELLNDYISHLKLLNHAKGTVKSHRNILQKFISYLKTLNIQDIIDIQQRDIINYQKNKKQFINRYGKHDAIETQNRNITTIKKFFLYIKREGFIVSDPSANMDYIKTPRRLPKSALTYKEFKQFIAQIDTSTNIGYRDRTIVELFYSSALRRNELRSLKLKDLDFKDGFLRVIGKGDKERVVPIGVKACNYLETYIKGVRPNFFDAIKSEHVFLSKKGQQISESALNEMILKYGKASKIKKHITPHTLRRSAATGMIRNKANIMLVREMLGHDSIEAIKRYLDLTIVDLKEAHQKTHPRENG